jgi:hypothetical protein
VAPDLIEKLKGVLGYPTATRVACESTDVMRSFRAACIAASVVPGENVSGLPTSALAAKYTEYTKQYPWVPEFQADTPLQEDYISMLAKLHVLTSCIVVQYSVRIDAPENMVAEHNNGTIIGSNYYPDDQTFPMVVVFHGLFLNGIEYNITQFFETPKYTILSLWVDYLPTRQHIARLFDSSLITRFSQDISVPRTTLGLPERKDAVDDMYAMHNVEHYRNSGNIDMKTTVFWLKSGSTAYHFLSQADVIPKMEMVIESFFYYGDGENVAKEEWYTRLKGVLSPRTVTGTVMRLLKETMPSFGTIEVGEDEWIGGDCRGGIESHDIQKTSTKLLATGTRNLDVKEKCVAEYLLHRYHTFNPTEQRKYREHLKRSEAHGYYGAWNLSDSKSTSIEKMIDLNASFTDLGLHLM